MRPRSGSSSGGMVPPVLADVGGGGPAGSWATRGAARKRASGSARNVARDVRIMPTAAPWVAILAAVGMILTSRSEEHTSELQSHSDLVCRLLLEKKKHT